MSFSRCGLQYNRDSNISNDTHNHPRSRQLQCWIIGDIVKPKESTTSIEVVDQQEEDNIDLKAQEKKLLEEIVGKDEQAGSGIMDIVRAIPIKRILGELPMKKIGETVAAKVSNLFPDSDENAREIFPGEYHAIVKLPNGKYGRANYSGAGTHIVKRLKRLGGDPPRVMSDKVSQAHDIRYALAQQALKPTDAVRDADEKYVDKMRQLGREGLDSSVNIQPAMRTIQAKMKAEDWSLMSRDKFIDTNVVYSDADNRLLKDKLTDLEQQGFGSVRSRRKTRFSPSTEKNPKSRTTSFGNQLGYLKQKGGAQSPGEHPSNASQSINVHTAPEKGRVNLRANVFDIQYPRKPGNVVPLGRYGANLGTRYLNASASTQGGVSDKMQGSGYPGSDIVNVKGMGISLPGSGRKRKPVFPADKLLKKMRKKIKMKGTTRNPVYFNDRDMSSFLATKLLPMISAR